jgi:hypothetical protein
MPINGTSFHVQPSHSMYPFFAIFISFLFAKFYIATTCCYCCLLLSVLNLNIRFLCSVLYSTTAPTVTQKSYFFHPHKIWKFSHTTIIFLNGRKFFIFHSFGSRLMKNRGNFYIYTFFIHTHTTRFSIHIIHSQRRFTIFASSSNSVEIHHVVILFICLFISTSCWYYWRWI